jgi:hypothetical protein
MAGVKRFEDLVCWQLATELEDLVPALVANPKAAADREFCDQILRATAKVAPQIAEGFARFRPGETAYYLRIAPTTLSTQHGAPSTSHVAPLAHLAPDALSAPST